MRFAPMRFAPLRFTRRVRPRFAEVLFFAFALLLTASFAAAAGVGAEPLTIGTFNVHYLAPGQTDLAWERRSEAVARAVEGGVWAGDHYPVAVTLKCRYSKK
ncbi:MAG: hypothetical protein ACLFPV_02750 [Spirochaetaceae bacterium]